MKAIFTTPDYLPEKMREDFSDKVESVLKKVFNLYAIEEFGATDVHTYVLCNDGDRLKDVALLIFGIDWQPAIDKLKDIRIFVEGRCPECGELLEPAYDELLCQDIENGRPSEGVTYQKCTSCKWNDYEKRA